MNNLGAPSTSSRFRIAPLYGDAEILLTLWRTDFWKQLFTKNSHSWMVVLREFFKLKLAMLSFSTNALFRYKFGSRTVGLVLSILATLMIVGWNSSYLYVIAKPIFPFTAGFFVPFKDASFWHNLILDDIYSTPMLYYTCAFLTLALVHSISIWFGFGNNDDPTKRGNSIIYAVFFKYTRVSEFFVQAVLEPVVICLTAGCLWYFTEEKVFALFLATSGLSTLVQEILDRAYQTRMKVPGSSL